MNMEISDFPAYVKRVFPNADIRFAEPNDYSSTDEESVFVNISNVQYSQSSEFATKLARSLQSKGYKVFEKAKKDGLPLGQTGECDCVALSLVNHNEGNCIYIVGVGDCDRVSLIATISEI